MGIKLTYYAEARALIAKLGIKTQKLNTDGEEI